MDWTIHITRLFSGGPEDDFSFPVGVGSPQLEKAKFVFWRKEVNWTA